MASSQRRPIIAGNWKMFKTTPEAAAFTEALQKRVQAHASSSLPEIVICPAFTALTTVKDASKKLSAPFEVAAQNMDCHDNGAYTGEISPLMLLDLNIRWVLIGHSERRQYFNETDETVAAKTLAALKYGMTPVVCVGELLQEREANQTDRVIEQQVRAVIDQVDAKDFPKLVFAYEPVWAIGTGKVCEADEANRVCKLIRTLISEKGSAEQTRILYGGSVKPENTSALMNQSDIDGGLVGGASLDPDSFFGIIEQACLLKV
jgi:triosephosphate isomerase